VDIKRMKMKSEIWIRWEGVKLNIEKQC